MSDLIESKNRVKEKIYKFSYYLLCGLIIAGGLYFIIRSITLFQ